MENLNIAMSFDEETTRVIESGGLPPSIQFGGVERRGSAVDPWRTLVKELEQNMVKITSYIGKMQNLVSRVGKADEQTDLRQQLHNIRHMSQTSVEETKMGFLKLRSWKVDNDMAKKTTKDKLIRDWGGILQAYGTTLKRLKDSERTSLAFVSERKRTITEKSKADYVGGNEPRETTSLLDDDSDLKRQEQAYLENELAFNEELIHDRENALVEVEANINDINDMFIDLGMAVKEQGIEIESIETNIMSVVDNTDKGLKDIGKASRWQKRARTKLCLLLLIVIVALIVLVIIVAVFIELGVQFIAIPGIKK